MQLVGFYPFFVSVWNFFAPSTGVKVKVTFNYHKCYTDENSNFKAEYIQNKSTYIIEPGMSLAFPMYFGDETLDVELDTTGKIPQSDYLISTGESAESFQTGLGEPQEGSSCGHKTVKGETYWMGGTWQIGPTNSTWKIEIRKYITDPQSEDVTVGPGTPG